ncbi:hypothetical protein WEI85_32580 [Actinomycetes bacterium KLBMP 9797]
MAFIHRATLKPTKLELLAAWLPTRDWYAGPAGDQIRVAGYRFDDPAGEVGIETLLVRSGDGPIHQVPLTYRGAPLAGADGWLIGTSEHSALGTRWIYDGCGDPVYAAALASAILADTGQAEEVWEVDGALQLRPPTMGIASGGSRGAEVPTVAAVRQVVDGDPARVVTDAVELTVARRLGGGAALAGTVLTGTWPDQPAPHPLAAATPLP